MASWADMGPAEREAHWKERADEVVKERDQEIATRRRAQQDRDTAYRLVVEAEAREAKLRGALRDMTKRGAGGAGRSRHTDWACRIARRHGIDPATLADRECRCSGKPHAEGAPECSFGRWFKEGQE